MKPAVPRNALGNGWDTEYGYICDGCALLGYHEHRCHRSDGGPTCVCPVCKEPTAEELAEFMATL